MKPATPILRNEHYLDVMTGGSASLPSPILREERYLAKLAGMEVSIPNPVTIKEKYYAKICGMDVDVPTYTRNMPRIYAYMAKAAGQTIEDLPTAVTREQRYWYDYVSEQPVTEHEYTGAVPYTFRADGSPLISWRISGNTVQNGTPTPDNPIMPEGTGERTGNLFYSSNNQTAGSTLHITQTIGNSKFILNKNESQTDTSANIDIDVTLPAGTYTLSVTGLNLYNNDYDRVFLRDDNSTIVVQNVQVNRPQSFTLTETTHIYRATVVAAAQSTYNNTNISIMLNTGSTPLPYEPYGYKIPISSADTTTNNYLGEVETTRKVEKLVLDGTEDWMMNADGWFYLTSVSDDYLRSEGNITSMCSHYPTYKQSSAIAQLPDDYTGFSWGSAQRLYLKDTAHRNDLSSFKQWVAAQYAAGTPVTIWYVLATPETAVVNEPIRKIGDYADSISMEQAGVSIPTNNGSTTVDVETTLKPSEVYIKWKGV